MVSPTVFARRCLCYLISDLPQQALGDAMQAQAVSPEWPTAFYLQAASLFSLGMDTDAQETLKDGSSLEAKNHGNWKCIAFRIYFFPFKLTYSHVFISICFLLRLNYCSTTGVNCIICAWCTCHYHFDQNSKTWTIWQGVVCIWINNTSTTSGSKISLCLVMQFRALFSWKNIKMTSLLWLLERLS